MDHIDIYKGAIAIRKTRPQEQHLPIYDNTRLVAVNTCPRWAAVRYGHNKVFGSGTSRALALEAGAACHHAFAAIRLFQLYNTHKEHALYHAKRLFPRDDAWQAFIQVIKSENLDEYMIMNELCGLALEYSQYYDDPGDKRRTLVNMEEALAKYTSRYDITKPIWVKDDKDPTALVGIEIPFDLLLTYKDPDTTREARFVGRIDGISVNNDKLVLEENKTTSQINASWIAQWHMSHQVTGYMIAVSTLAMQQCQDADIMGLAIPQPRQSAYDGLIVEGTKRNPTQINNWLKWFFTSVAEFNHAKDDWFNASMYTHSCTRYFRECSLIPLCSAERDEQEQIFNNEMAEQVWNPLAEDVAE